jgi:hypothetical protein
MLNEKTRKVLEWFSGAPLRILVILLVAIVAQLIIGRAITRIMDKIATADLKPGPGNLALRQKERAKTTGTVLRSTTNAIVWVIFSL